ncbi:TPA: DUF3168 domain-containing protein [Klebsiella michiganensis]
MIAPIFSVCEASATLKALIGANPIRLYPFGLQDDEPIYPYVVWQNIDGSPPQYLGTRPDHDGYAIQVDIYAKTSADVLAVAKALRDVIEPHAYITRWGGQTRDSETKNYRYSFDVDWLVLR